VTGDETGLDIGGVERGLERLDGGDVCVSCMTTGGWGWTICASFLSTRGSLAPWASTELEVKEASGLA
jgi:hypothetical protein